MSTFMMWLQMDKKKWLTPLLKLYTNKKKKETILMKVGVRGGHNAKSTGAVGVLNELEEDRKIYPHVISNLQRGGVSTIDLTPPSNLDFPTELYYGIKEANSAGLDLGMSIHLNCGGGHGCEVWIYDKANQVTVDRANGILNNLAKLGFYNRGIKRSPSGESLAEINQSKCSWILVEVCFVDSQGDANILNSVGYEAIGRAIAEGVIQKSLTGNDVIVKPAPVEVTGGYTVIIDPAKFSGSGSTLNIRSEASVNSNVTGSIKPGLTKYTIVEESNGFGKLKSGAGWVSLKYTKRV